MTAARQAARVFGLGVAGYLAWTTYRLTVGTARTVAELRDESAAAAGMGRTAAGPVRVAVVLPMLREDAIADSTCRHFAAIAATHPHLVIIVVTSEQEAAERDAAAAAATADGRSQDWERNARRVVRAEAVAGLATAVREGDRQRVDDLLARHRRPTTAEVVAPLVIKLNATLGREAFLHMVAPASAGTKVAKLNHAVEAWRRRGDEGQGPAYIGIYDADSAPDPLVFTLLEQEISRRSAVGQPGPAILQQVSCYCRNLPALKGLLGALSLADAIAQTRWALGFEYPLYRRYSGTATGGEVRPLAYCVGHGCFVALDFLDRIGGFPSVSATDDLALGYIASALGAEIAPLPALDYCEVAPDVISSALQSRFWFSGSARFWRDLRYARRSFEPPLSAPQWAWLHVSGFGRNVAWAGRGPAWLAAFAFALGTRQPRLAGLLVAAHIAYAQGGYLQTVRALGSLPGGAERSALAELSGPRVAAGCLAASAAFLLRSVGPFASATAALASWLPHRTSKRNWKHER